MAASINMTTASLLGGLSPSKLPSTTGRHRRGLVIAKASGAAEVDLNCKTDTKKESGCGRRSLVSTAAAVVVAACSFAGVAFADEPKPGTPEAKKKYGPVCVTMPTARICRK